MKGTLAQIKEKYGDYTPCWRLTGDIWTTEKPKKDNVIPIKKDKQAIKGRSKIKGEITVYEAQEGLDDAKNRTAKKRAVQRYFDSLKAQCKAFLDKGERIEIQVKINELEFNL